MTLCNSWKQIDKDGGKTYCINIVTDNREDYLMLRGQTELCIRRDEYRKKYEELREAIDDDGK